MRAHHRSMILGLAALGLAVSRAAADQEPAQGPPRRVEALETTSGQRIAGRIVAEPRGDYRFVPDGGGQPAPLEPGSVVVFEGPDPSPLTGLPPFHVVLGTDQRVSGRLVGLNETELRIEAQPGRPPIAIARGGALALLQRPGEAQVLADGFETLDAARWSQVGEPDVAPEPHMAGASSLRLEAGGSSVTCRLPEPVGSGRFEVAYYDSGVRVPGHRWFVDLTFRTPSGPQPIRAVLGWEEPSLAVESLQGPTLAVQRLARAPGWHRLVIRFGPGGTELAVDGNDLAHGNGPDGPLVEIRLASHVSGKAAEPASPAGFFDDLSLARLAEPAGDLEIDPTQDELRLVGGDQLYGHVRSADPEHIVVHVAGKDAMLAWNEVAGIYFRRAAAQSAPVDGLLVRVEWRAAAGNDPHDADRLEGALSAISPTSLTLTTPYAGSVSIPRDQLRRLQVLGRSRRLVVDPTAHHLGDSVFNNEIKLDPPQPQSTPLEVPFEVAPVPPGKAFVSLDVVQVTPEEGNSRFSALVRKGELRTHVLINGKEVDYINHHITSKNETPERIRLPIPAGVLRAGRNVLTIRQEGEAKNPDSLDDLGVLAIALEFESRPDGQTPPDENRGP